MFKHLEHEHGVEIGSSKRERTPRLDDDDVFHAKRLNVASRHLETRREEGPGKGLGARADVENAYRIDTRAKPVFAKDSPENAREERVPLKLVEFECEAVGSHHAGVVAVRQSSIIWSTRGTCGSKTSSQFRGSRIS